MYPSKTPSCPEELHSAAATPKRPSISFSCLLDHETEYQGVVDACCAARHTHRMHRISMFMHHRTQIPREKGQEGTHACWSSVSGEKTSKKGKRSHVGYARSKSSQVVVCTSGLTQLATRAAIAAPSRRNQLQRSLALRRSCPTVATSWAPIPPVHQRKLGREALASCATRA